MIFAVGWILFRERPQRTLSGRSMRGNIVSMVPLSARTFFLRVAVQPLRQKCEPVAALRRKIRVHTFVGIEAYFGGRRVAGRRLRAGEARTCPRPLFRAARRPCLAYTDHQSSLAVYVPAWCARSITTLNLRKRSGVEPTVASA